MGGFAIHPAPGRRPSDSLPPSAAGNGTTTTTTTTSSSSSSSAASSFSLDDAVRRGVHHHHHQTRRTPGHTLEEPPSRRRNRAEGRHGNGASSSSSRSARLLQRLRHALPVLTLTPRCGKMQQVGTPSEIAAAASSSSSSSSCSSSSAAPAPKGVSFSRPCRRVTGTLYGHRRGRVVLALQETPRCLPTLVVELALQTHALLRELGNPAGARIVLETERRAVSLSEPAADARATRGGGRGRAPPLLDEPSWTMFCNGKKTGYAVRREATDDDLTVMETLRVVSMGAGVLPGTRATSLVIDAAAVAADDEVPYMRGCFDHFIGSRDSESLYMVAPQGGGTGPELAVFFVRL
ncbi:hypothetical protein BDA96_07G059700 [Sorghum bicolor]|uniref:Protein MIZU-KUSSEI 1 n=1 Tax=Sorghum bicolor TaxID=4558 RepID=A0A921QKU7_SORBI|nr:hypothetical protein BDA96_07G059700 [Sorghum bicolor]